MPDDVVPVFAVVETPSGFCLSGEIDGDAVAVLAPLFDPLPGGEPEVRIDLEGVSFIDSCGLRLLIQAHQRAETVGRALIIEHPSRTVARLLAMSGLSSQLNIAE